MSFIINPYVFAVGGGTPAPSTIASIWEWWEPWREVGLNDEDQITTLNGQVNNRDWIQASGAPFYDTTNPLNGHAVAKGGGNQWQTGPNMSALTAVHAFIILQVDADPPGSSGNTGLWDVGTDTLSSHYPFTTGVVFDAGFSTARKTIGDPTPALTAWRVYEVVSVSGEYTVKLDGTQIFTTATNTVGCPASPQLLRNRNGDVLAGRMAGFYMFSAKLTTDRATMVSYINSEFGLSMV